MVMPGVLKAKVSLHLINFGMKDGVHHMCQSSAVVKRENQKLENMEPDIWPPPTTKFSTHPNCMQVLAQESWIGLGIQCSDKLCLHYSIVYCMYRVLGTY